ncbi:MAG: hypothetical protein WC607_01180 [Candidatus Micrarchaeia archaeon]
MTIILFACLAFANTAMEEGRLYADGLEEVSLASVSVGGNDYHILLFDNVESVVLDADSLEAVTDSAKIEAVAVEYQKAQLPLLDPDSKYAAVNASFAPVDSVAGDCVEGLQFFFSRPGSQLIVYTRGAPNQYPRSHDVLEEPDSEFINVSSFNDTSQLGDAHSDLWDAFNAMQSSVATLEAARDSDSIDDAVTALHTIVENTDALLLAYNASWFYINEIEAEWNQNFMYMWINGQERNCEAYTELASGISALESAASAPEFETTDELISRIISETAERAPMAAQLKVVDEKRDALSEFSVQANAIISGFAAYNAGSAFFAGEYAALNASFDAMAAEGAEDSLEANAAAFDAKFAEVKALADSYSLALQEYSGARDVLANASTHLAAAAEKYGGTDERIVSLQATVQQLNSRLTVEEQLLSSGAYNGSTAELDLIYVNATSVNAAAFGMQPRENELDWVMIGGIIVLLLTLVGGFIYLKKYKDEGGFGGGPSGPKFHEEGTSSSPGTIVER